MASFRLLLRIMIIPLVFGLEACSKSDNGPQPGVALFAGCPVTSQTENYPQTKNGDPSGSATPRALFSNSPSRLYAVGSQIDGNGLAQGLVRISNDGGVTWSTFDKSSGPAGQGAVDNAIVTDPSGTHIYIAQTYNNNSLTAPSIRYSDDGGQKFNDFAIHLNSQNNETLKSIVIGSSGTPYFIGTSEDANHKKTGFVGRLKKDYSVGMRSALDTDYRQIAVLPSDKGSTLLVAGVNTKDSNNPTWLLENGKEEGKDWPSPKDFFPTNSDDKLEPSLVNLFGVKSTVPGERKKVITSPLTGLATSVMVTDEGNIFEGGVVNSAPGVGAWIIRKSTNKGESFTISDTFKDPQFKSSIPLAITYFDGHPVVVGSSRDVLGQSHWHVRYAMNQNSKWITLSSAKMSSSPIDDPDEESARAVGVWGSSTSDGRSLIILGDSKEADGTHQWKVQKISQCVRPH